MRSALGYVVVLAVAGTTTSPATVVRADDRPPHIAIDGASIDGKAVGAFWHFSRLRRCVTRDRLVEEVIDNFLLAREARQHHSVDELDLGAQVAVPADVNAEERLLAILRNQYAARIKESLAQLPGGRVEGLAGEFAAPDEAAWATVFGGRDRPVVGAALGDREREAAGKVVLFHYTLPSSDTARAMTLAQVYARQNVQGRIRLQNRDVDFLHRESLRYLLALYLVDRATAWEGADFVASLQGLIADEATAQTLMRWYGLAGNDTGEALRPDALMGAVTPAEIRAYYKVHKEDFRQIDRVKAWHIRTANEADARAAITELNGRPSEFSRVAKQRSIARDAASGGDLGWMDVTRSDEWLVNFVFTQQPGVISSPIRTPTAGTEEAPWEIVLVDRKVESYMPADSETVAWAARNAIAKDKAALEYRQLRERLRKAAGVEVTLAGNDASECP